MSIQVRNDRLVDILRADFSALNHDHSGLGTPIALNDLTDAQITSGDLGDYLRNNGAGQWVDVAVGQLLTDLLTVDGTGSLLDADLLDGQDAASFQPTDPTLTALASFNTNGLLTQTAADTFTGRTIIAPAAGITVTNGDGVAGNPTLVLANDLAALEGLGSTGIAVRSATDTWVQRSIAAGTALGVTNGNGVSGNPTVAVTDVELLAIAGLTSAADQLPYFTGSGTAALTTLTAFIRTLLDDATQGAAQATLGVVPGTNVQPQDATLTALAAFNTNGLLTQTAADTFAGRTLTAPAAGFTITNPAGIAGNPTFVLANDLSALEGLGSVGLAVRSASDTWVQRTITAGAAIGITDGNGVSSNPIVAVTDVELLALAGLTSAADQLPYFTGSGTAALTTLTSFIRTLLDDATQGAAQATLGVTPGQPLDAFLTSIALLGTAADRMIYTTAVDTAAETVLSAFARSFLDDASEAVFKATVNLETGVDVQAWDTDLDALAALAATAGLLARTGAGAFAVRALTAPAAGITVTNGTGAAGNPTLVLANDLAGVEGLSTTGLAVRSATDTWLTRSIASGTAITVTNGDGVSGNPSVAVSDVELLAIAGLTSAADSLPYFTGSGTAALTTLTSFIRTLLDDATQGAAQATLGLAIGTNVQAWDADLDALAALAATAGMLSRTGAGAFAVRTLTAPAAGITISNPTGSAGNPTWALANDLAAAEGLSTNGLVTRTATDAWTTRSLIAPAAGITVTNGDGVAGNPTLVLANDLSALEGLASTGLAARTATDAWAQRTITGTTNRITVTNGNGVSGNPTIDIDNSVFTVGGAASEYDKYSPLKNGNFQGWLNGTSFVAVASGTITADEFTYTKVSTAVHTVSRSTDVPTVAQAGILPIYSIQMDVTTADVVIAAGDLCTLSNNVIGYDFLSIAQVPFTLSFWVKAAKTGTHCVAFRNSGSDRSYVAEYTVSVANTWEFKAINVSASPSAGTWNYADGIGLKVSWVLFAGTTFHTTANAWNTGNFLATSAQVNELDNMANNFFITLAQINPGTLTSPTLIYEPYDYRPGVWKDWTTTPVVTQGATPTLTVDWARYAIVGKTVFLNVRLVITSAGTPSQVITISNIPTALRPVNADDPSVLGTGIVYDDSAGTQYVGALVPFVAGSFHIRAHAEGGVIGSNPSLTLANTDVISFSATYEIA